MSTLIFIDARVADAGGLPGTFAADVELVILDSGQDGVTQIAAALAGVTDLDSIHIISHGSPGALYLGSTVLTEDNLDDYGDELAQIGAALSEDGDLLLYGCEAGAGARGQSFIHALAHFTGADIAASTDLTGHAALGGDWLLEASTGAVATAPLVNGQTGFYGLLAPPAVTPGGTLDTTFDTDGKVTTAFAATNTPDWGYAVAIQDNGKILVAGEHDGAVAGFGVARYNSDGGLDTTFGGDGTVATESASQARGLGVAVQSNGKIVVAGHADTDPTATTNLDFAVVRYNTNGSLDTTFSGDGKVTTAIGTGHDQAFSMAIQSNDKIVLAGNSTVPATSTSEFALARYNTNGSLDSTFGGDGKVTTDFGLVSEVAWAVAVQADGKIVVAGTIFNGSDDDFVVVRYTTSGNLDSTFSGDGKATTNFGTTSDVAYSVAIQSDGRIVVAGNSGSEFAVARYNTDGSPDTSFSGDGRVASDIATGLAQGGVAIQADGRIVVAGHYSGLDLDFLLLRYNADGSLDTTFDNDGRIEFPSIGADYAHGLAIQPDGAIVMGGASSQFVTGMDFAVVRVMPGGIPDQSAPAGDLYHYTFPPNLFTDPEGDPLTYSASLADGSALPSWLSFNAATRTFSGTPGLGDQGSFSIRVTASDGTLSNSDVYVLEVGLFGTAAANTLTGTSFDDLVDGLAGNDTLSGGAGNDTLDGGPGVDVMRGGSGSDLYLVDRATDRVVETSNAAVLSAEGPAAIEGIIDTVIASVKYSLSGVDYVENLTLTGTATRGTGNELDNGIAGNGRANVLSGLAGADTIVGAGGKDMLSGASGSDILSGGGGKDTLGGGNGNDILGGGGGKDRLTGSGGADRFDFNTALNVSMNVDRITDFSRADDTIRLDVDIFTAFATANKTLAQGAFYKDATVTDAHDSSDRILYNTSTGNLYYDADGAGGKTAKLFATLVDSPDGITNADFFIVA